MRFFRLTFLREWELVRTLADAYDIPRMTLPLAAYIVIFIAVCAGALGLSAFIWAIRHKQFSLRQLNSGAMLIFDKEEPVGQPQDQLFVPKNEKVTRAAADHRR